MILQKTIIIEKNKNAISVDDFYYRGMDEKLNGKKGTGVRGLAATFIKLGKILDRYLILRDEGCTLEIYTIFNTMEDLNEFTQHPIAVNARNFWVEQNWYKSTEVIPIQDYLTVRNRVS
jgi:hypothetical protein